MAEQPPVYDAREAISLPFVAGLQHLAAGQRAVLLLRDVAGFSAAEIATMLESTEWAVEGALREARNALAARLPPEGEPAPAADSRRERELAGRFADAFEQGDVEAIGALLSDDAFLMMPPYPLERKGRAPIEAFLAEQFRTRRGRRVQLSWTRANGHPAFGHYIEDTNSWRALGVIALTLEGERLSGLTRFADTAIMPRLGLPRVLPL